MILDEIIYESMDAAIEHERRWNRLNESMMRLEHDALVSEDVALLEAGEDNWFVKACKAVRDFCIRVFNAVVNFVKNIINFFRGADKIIGQAKSYGDNVSVEITDQEYTYLDMAKEIIDEDCQKDASFLNGLISRIESLDYEDFAAEIENLKTYNKDVKSDLRQGRSVVKKSGTEISGSQVAQAYSTFKNAVVTLNQLKTEAKKVHDKVKGWKKGDNEADKKRVKNANKLISAINKTISIEMRTIKNATNFCVQIASRIIRKGKKEYKKDLKNNSGVANGTASYSFAEFYFDD